MFDTQNTEILLFSFCNRPRRVFLYEFTRVPFGLRQHLATSSKIYIDDIITGGDSEEDLLVNLRRVFKRLAEHNIKLNPKKLKIGLTEIEYVGHVLSAEGVNMTGEKILKVLDFVRPQTVKTLRSFLGLTAYFQNHILNYALVVNPLHKMLLGGKNQSVTWDEQCIAAFAHIKAQ